MTKIYELETERLYLRQWTEADKAPFANLNADERVMEFFPRPLSRSESDAMVDRIQRSITQRGWGWWAVEVKHKHPFIGFVGLNIPSVDLPFNPCVETGWRLDSSYWGRGYATEAASAALSLGFGTLALDEIVAFTTVDNVRSQAVVQKLGMHRAPSTFIYPGESLEHYLYKRSRADWQAQNPSTP
ncbi:GNAT family N-acetyltransferase [Leptolyngbya sp. BC1307]|uniref:GNAT family N-acetyltransferase n=1 Tax=Leptolyngbya sp. BC1307 TaxID=2029589 RepID=UPI000EFC7642|nr:GNAT family N-acetyltransferase [Leptolyngbya sp. BC1307]